MPSSQRMRNAFTLIELLMVIAIIALLIGTLLPALGGARDAARQSVCLSAQRQLGIGIIAYAASNTELLPWHEDWTNLAGKSGTVGGVATQTGLPGEPGVIAPRVVNEFLGNIAEAARCPGDVGDAKHPGVNNCFDAYGISFQPEWKDHHGLPWNGSVSVFGASVLNADGTRSAAPRARFNISRGSSRIDQPIIYGPVQPRSGGRLVPTNYAYSWERKVLLGDYNWHANRPITDPRVLWHRPSSAKIRQQNILFGDGHAEFFAFPTDYTSEYFPVNYSKNRFW